MPRLKQSQGRTCGLACGIAFALLWTGMSFIFALMAWKEGELLGALVPGVFVIVGLVMLVGFMWRPLARLRLGRPHISASQDELRVGEDFTVRYDQQIRTPTHVEMLSVMLVFLERATYQQGTDTRTVKHEEIVDRFDFPGRQFQAGETFRQICTFKIPSDAMHTFEAQHNKLQWWIRVVVKISGWADLQEEFMVRVLPERVW